MKEVKVGELSILSTAWNININCADICSGIFADIGLAMMSVKTGRSFSSLKNALMSALALLPIVPLNAHMVALSPSFSLLSTMTEHLSNERGVTKDNCFFLGLNI